MPTDQPELTPSSTPSIEIKELEARRLAVISVTGPYDQIGPAFQKLFAWADCKGLLGPGVTGIAVYFDNPDIVPAAELKSFAALPVPATFQLTDEDAPVEIYETAPGRCAVMIHNGPYTGLPAAYGHLYGTWFPQSGHTPSDAPCLEEYLNDPSTTPPAELVTQISVPLLETTA